VTINDKIVMYGMSCSGKTTFAKQLSLPYICFDALFQWHLIELLGLSTIENLKYIKKICDEKQSFVLDGWTLADKEGEYFPDNIWVYVVYAEYDRIVNQYRIEVTNRDEFREMYKKWYDIVEFPRIRYFKNSGEFCETSKEEFICLVGKWKY